MRKTLVAAVAAALALALPGAAGANCLRFSQSTDARGLVLRLENRCKEDMSCSLTWRITCVGAAGRKTTPHSESGSVAPGESRTWSASAEECNAGDGYQISAPEWSCKTVPSMVTVRR